MISYAGRDWLETKRASIKWMCQHFVGTPASTPQTPPGNSQKRGVVNNPIRVYAVEVSRTVFFSDKADHLIAWKN
jgi:hypothetical protein